MKHLPRILFSILLVFTGNPAFAKGVSVDAPYVREVPPGQMISASFMTLKNDTDKKVALIKASSDVAKSVELHEHVHEGGMMKMRQVPKIVIPAHGTTELKPGGYHIMLIGLQRKIKAGDKVELDLEFDNGDKKTISATVKKIMMGMMKNGMKPGKKMDHSSTAKLDDNPHLNPMPNLMPVVMENKEQLQISAEQIKSLKEGTQKRKPLINEALKKITQLEAKIKNSALGEATISDLDALGDKIMQERLTVMQGKAYCRDDIKKILNHEQFSKLIKIYKKNHPASPAPKDNEKTKIAMMKHVNPMPNLMMVVKKMSDKLGLSEKQATTLKQWRDERGPVIKKLLKEIIETEKSIKEAVLDDAPYDTINEMANEIATKRMRIIRGKSFCRDKMRMILNPDQYKKVIELYKANYMIY